MSKSIAFFFLCSCANETKNGFKVGGVEFDYSMGLYENKDADSQINQDESGLYWEDQKKY